MKNEHDANMALQPKEPASWTIPRVSLLQGKPYTPAHATDIRVLFQQIKEKAVNEQRQC